MALDFERRRVEIQRGRGRRSINESIAFGSDVRTAQVAVNGFKLDFANKDHHINVVEIDTDIISISGNDVNFRAECAYADKNFDDEYSGYIEVLVIADVA